MKQPLVVERFTDNGEHSHWALIDTEDGKDLWDEFNKKKNQADMMQLLKDMHGLLMMSEVQYTGTHLHSRFYRILEQQIGE